MSEIISEKTSGKAVKTSHDTACRNSTISVYDMDYLCLSQSATASFTVTENIENVSQDLEYGQFDLEPLTNSQQETLFQDIPHSDIDEIFRKIDATNPNPFSGLNRKCATKDLMRSFNHWLQLNVYLP